MKLVLDASATIALFYGEISGAERSRLEDAIEQSGAAVPQLWHLEVVNVLLIGYRKGRHGLDALRQYLSDIALPRITVDSETQSRAWGSVLELAAKHGLTSYDAAYLELAIRLRASLATLDKGLVQAARDEGVRLFWN